MSSTFTWSPVDASLPVKEIYYDPQMRRLTVELNKGDYENQREGTTPYDAAFKKFDEGAYREGGRIVMSRNTSPQGLAAFLKGKGWIDEACFKEIETEIKQYLKEQRDDRPL